MEFINHIAIFSGVSFVFMLFLGMIWSTKTWKDTFIKFILLMFGVYGGLIFMQAVKFFGENVKIF